MFKMIKLEWKKNDFNRYFISAFICSIIIFGVVALMAKSAGTDTFPNYASFMSLSNIFIRIVFVIFSGVLLSRLVIEEYKTKTIQLLFTYPVKRKQLLQAKLLMVVGFCFTGILLATLVVNAGAYFLNPVIGLFGSTVTVSEMVQTIPQTLISAGMIAGLSLIPLYFGMRKKSTATTITSAVIIGFLVNATVSEGGQSASMFEFIGIPIVFCLIGLAIGYLSYRKIDRIDVA